MGESALEKARSETLTLHTPLWEKGFLREAAALVTGLEESGFYAPTKIKIVAAEHVGSTAVEGLLSRPVIDILLRVDPFPLPDYGYDFLNLWGYRPADTPIPAGTYLVRTYNRFKKTVPVTSISATPKVAGFELYVTSADSSFSTDQLLLRDYLRTHIPAKTMYSTAKRHLSLSGLTRKSYRTGRLALIRDLLVQARSWEKDGRQDERRQTTRHCPFCAELLFVTTDGGSSGALLSHLKTVHSSPDQLATLLAQVQAEGADT